MEALSKGTTVVDIITGEKIAIATARHCCNKGAH